MTEYTIKIKRRKNRDESPYWQEFNYSGSGEETVAGVLRTLPVEWECSCLVRKCGACAMRINGVPSLACGAFLKDIAIDGRITLEPLSKFPVIRDLIVDRSVVYDNARELSTWPYGDRENNMETLELRRASAGCLMCGCCLEVCPNFCVEGEFAGAVAAVNSYRIISEGDLGNIKKTSEGNERRTSYISHYYKGCGKSLSCHDICPIGLPVEELLLRSNRIAVWGRSK